MADAASSHDFGKVWTCQPQLAPARFVRNQADRRGMAIESLVSGGGIVSGSVLPSVPFSGVRAHAQAEVDGSVWLPGVVTAAMRARLQTPA